MKRRRTRPLLAAITAATLLIGGAVVAQGATYTWRNANSNPGVTYTENSSARGFSRTGVYAEVDIAGSHLVKTNVWMGATSATGTTFANLTGPRSFAITKARWDWSPNPNDSGSVRMLVHLTGAVLSGTSRLAPNAAPAIGPDFRLYSESVVTGAEIPGIGDLGSRGITDVVPETLQELGSSANAEFWTIVGRDDSIHLIAVEGDQLASTRVAAEEFAVSGATLRTDSSGETLQVVFVPEMYDQAPELSTAGLERIAASLYVDRKLSPLDSVVDVAPTAGAKNGRTAPLQVRLFDAPVE